MAAPVHEPYRREAELRPQHSRDGSRDSGIFHTTKGLWNAPGLNNCFLNSAVQVNIRRQSYDNIGWHTYLTVSRGRFIFKSWSFKIETYGDEIRVLKKSVMVNVVAKNQGSPLT
ncbi:hypothetical protein RR48_12510 [Papilio machaon]|uniref:Uncharacterized protein n=1 Tax=Papilio machaon TaxID=76193 RepID=A0A194RNL0_PAPMA|nr:hypothetical protein RR48_12510 [Papilio machaon]